MNCPKAGRWSKLLRDWQRRMLKHGFVAMAWPKEYGGQGASAVEMAIFNEECARVRAPGRAQFAGHLAGRSHDHPARHARRKSSRFLPAIVNADEIWCQGFSEPNAGSDLASLRTRAELVGDEFIVNGQKIWTSYAQYADWCYLLVRTDPAAPKHRGISYLLVDMKTPGITVKPLRQMHGGQDFNEVFFENVHVPRQNLLGALNDGWRVSMTTLANERGTSALSQYVRYEQIFNDLVQLGAHVAQNGSAGAAGSGGPPGTGASLRRFAGIQVRLLPRLFGDHQRRHSGSRRLDSEAAVVRAQPADAGDRDVAGSDRRAS